MKFVLFKIGIIGMEKTTTQNEQRYVRKFRIIILFYSLSENLSNYFNFIKVDENGPKMPMYRDLPREFVDVEDIAQTQPRSRFRSCLLFCDALQNTEKMKVARFMHRDLPREFVDVEDIADNIFFS